MQTLAAVRLTANLNSVIAGRQTLEQAERAVVGPDVAHHVIDPDGVLGLDPAAAATLDEGLERCKALEPEGWFLALPVPGALGPLRGPVVFNRAALEVGEAVVASTCGVGLVPVRVGAAVQWRVYGADRPFAPASPYDAERALNEVVLAAAAALAALEVGQGRRPPEPVAAALAPGYSPRQQTTAIRAARLMAACGTALRSDGSAVSSFEADRRAFELRRVHACAREALCSAVSWCR